VSLGVSAFFVYRDFYRKPPWCIIPDMLGEMCHGVFFGREGSG
jgi:hypothetical protein